MNEHRIDGYIDAEGALHFIAPMDGTLIVPAPSECPWTSADECAMAQERKMAGVGPSAMAFPCREHGGWCEVCEEFRADHRAGPVRRRADLRGLRRDGARDDRRRRTACVTD